MEKFRIVGKNEKLQHIDYFYFGVARHSETLEELNIYIGTSNTDKSVFPILKLGVYKHFKGKKYEVLGVAWYHKTREELVIYKALYDSEEFGENALWMRPLSNFLAIKKLKDVNLQRFKFIKGN